MEHKTGKLKTLYFDGRKDNTLQIIKEGDKTYRRTAVEEYISLVEEPGSSYIGHITPASGSVENILKGILAYLS